ncbi:MAG: hypothetical protein RL347_510 [Actinomycetota bacterium]|jgi:hypothetical protein
MSTRRAIAATVAVVGLAALVAAPVSAAQAKPGKTVKSAPSQNYCEDWQVDQLPPDYCMIEPAQAHVYVEFTNNSGREVRYSMLSGSNLMWVREWTSKPGRTMAVYGNANAGADIVGSVSWCPTVTYTSTCEGKLTADLKWKNPAIGWPWMQVGKDNHGFRALERYTFEHAYGPAGVKGVAKFKTQRLTDKASGTKRYTVDFTFAVR